MKFNNKIYVIFDKKSSEAVDCFAVSNKEVAIRFMNIRIAGAIENKNWGLISIWRDCKLFEYDMSGETIKFAEITDLERLLPQESNSNEKN